MLYYEKAKMSEREERKTMFEIIVLRVLLVFVAFMFLNVLFKCADKKQISDVKTNLVVLIVFGVFLAILCSVLYYLV
jgi:undecaprenyl pyrophosphate phosphatase UppP